MIAEGEPPLPLKVTVARIAKDATADAITRYFNIGDWQEDQTIYRVTLQDGKQVSFLFPLKVMPAQYMVGYTAGIEAVQARIRDRIRSRNDRLSELDALTLDLLRAGHALAEMSTLLIEKDCLEDLSKQIDLLNPAK